MSFSDLPVEILKEILEYTDGATTLSLTAVNRETNVMFKKDTAGFNAIQFNIKKTPYTWLDKVNTIIIDYYLIVNHKPMPQVKTVITKYAKYVTLDAFPNLKKIICKYGYDISNESYKQYLSLLENGVSIESDQINTYIAHSRIGDIKLLRKIIHEHPNKCIIKQIRYKIYKALGFRTNSIIVEDESNEYEQTKTIIDLSKFEQTVKEFHINYRTVKFINKCTSIKTLCLNALYYYKNLHLHFPEVTNIWTDHSSSFDLSGFSQINEFEICARHVDVNGHRLPYGSDGIIFDGHMPIKCKYMILKISSHCAGNIGNIDLSKINMTGLDKLIIKTNITKKLYVKIPVTIEIKNIHVRGISCVSSKDINILLFHDFWTILHGDKL